LDGGSRNLGCSGGILDGGGERSLGLQPELRIEAGELGSSREREGGGEREVVEN
jgi:hypothetical protein